uniref:DNA polymerase III subunit alpha n=1 Tax=Lachnoclostridium phocaeense TaxID=1871021 RepID=UPI0026DC45DC|nr:DNA polymerase III subunit alpha [Lachnoclostridium phocaeense]
MADTVKAYAFLHNHTVHSLLDSPLKIEEYVKKAAKMGAQAAAITDHGTCTGWIDFIHTCEKYKIKPIPGVEAYVGSKQRRHLVLLAKNYTGYQEISRAMTIANKQQEKNGGTFVPVMDRDLLCECFGHGNVIALSACVSGILAGVYLDEVKKKEKIKKLKEEAAEYGEERMLAYNETTKKAQELQKRIREGQARKDLIQALAKKNYKTRLRGLETLKAEVGEEDEVYKQTAALLKTEMEATRKANDELPEVKKSLASLRREKTEMTKKLSKEKKDVDHYKKIIGEISQISSSLKSKEEIYSLILAEAYWYQKRFGDDFYIELQYHGLETEKEVMPILARVAEEANIPVVATNDVHLLDKEQAATRSLLQTIRFSKYAAPEAADKELYLKSDEELEGALGKILGPDTVKEAMEGIQAIADQCNFKLPDTYHYPKYLQDGNASADSAALLREMVYQTIPDRYPEGFAAYDRLEYELQTIIDLGFADYLLIVADLVSYARGLAKEDSSHIGYNVGPGRGSGAGSLVNYLLGITTLDPLKYGLKFERFLNRNRVTMPDIDTDYSNEVREKVIAYATEKYGTNSVAYIRTNMTLGAKNAVFYAATSLAIEKHGKLVKNKDKYREVIAKGNEISSLIPHQPGIKLKDVPDLLDLLWPDKDYEVILKRALLLEGCTVSFGVHAAGVIIGDQEPLMDHIPLMYNSKKKIWAVQCDMVEAEELHLLKMDFLGLTNLDIITECLRRVKKNAGRTLDPDRLPLETEIINDLFAKGDTGFVFQFESVGMRKMLRDFQPNSFEDLILLVAAYRPGPMRYIPDMIAIKHGKEAPRYIVEELKEILEPTYGYPVYQEQIMDIFHKCAGFSLEEADIIRRYMSKKKVESFQTYRDRFVEGLTAKGSSMEDAVAYWDSIVDFSKYAFNKSHAAAYAKISYITGYLKYHYKTEYLCACLNHSEDDKKPSLLFECKRMGIQILPPDINRSKATFEEDGDRIRFGLNGIKGIASAASGIVIDRSQNGEYKSFQDYMVREHSNKGVTEKLIKAGAFDPFGYSRKSLLATLPELAKKIQSEKKKAVPYFGKIYEMQIRQSAKDDNELQEEKKVLGTFISSHPMEQYGFLYRSGTVMPLANISVGFGCYAGIITDFREAKTKKDGSLMAFFSLEDQTGEVPVICFPKKYREFSKILEEGKIIKVFGNVEYEKRNQETSYKLFIHTVYPCTLAMNPYFISTITRDMVDRIRQILKPFISEDGRPVIVHDAETGEISSLDIRLSRNIEQIQLPGLLIKKLNYKIM